MMKLSTKDARALSRLAEAYGADAIMSALKARIPKKVPGRPKDASVNDGIIWAHVEFLKNYRCRGPKKSRELADACDMLSVILERYSAIGRAKAGTTIRGIYFKAKRAAAHQPAVAVVMKRAYESLVQEIAATPERIPIPLLVESTGAGEKHPIVDREGFDGVQILGVRGSETIEEGCRQIVIGYDVPFCALLVPAIL
ncbi:hypothetical protein [Bradyrhizobium sp. RDM4]|uniref:hypothetical protein n=1 Tax=Bradyrhizobium sp. RDM4 TaxID=3378765 RepID=UPI0038FC71F2